MDTVTPSVVCWRKVEKIPSAIDLNFRDVFEGEEDGASDDVHLGGRERDTEDCEIVCVPSR